MMGVRRIISVRIHSRFELITKIRAMRPIVRRRIFSMRVRMRSVLVVRGIVSILFKMRVQDVANIAMMSPGVGRNVLSRTRSIGVMRRGGIRSVLSRTNITCSIGIVHMRRLSVTVDIGVNQ
jgi:hypothetical protein